MVKTSASNARFMGSIPGPKTRIPHADNTAKKTYCEFRRHICTVHLNEEHTHSLTHTFPLLDVYSTETYNYTHTQKT